MCKNSLDAHPAKRDLWQTKKGQNESKTRHQLDVLSQGVQGHLNHCHANNATLTTPDNKNLFPPSEYSVHYTRIYEFLGYVIRKPNNLPEMKAVFVDLVKENLHNLENVWSSKQRLNKNARSCMVKQLTYGQWLRQSS